MTRPDYLERGDTHYWYYDNRTAKWIPTSSPDTALVQGHSVMETYVTNVFHPEAPSPRKIPKYRPVYKPRAVKRKPMMPIALPHTLQ